LLASGLTEVEASRVALAELNESDLLTQKLRRVEHTMAPEQVVPGVSRGSNVIKDLGQDLRYGLRVLIKNPGFTAIAVLTLALGIGANTAIFSVVNAVLLRPLPYKDSDRLVMVWEVDQKKGANHVQVSAPNYVDWRDQNEVFEQIAAAFARPDTGVNLTDGRIRSGYKRRSQPGIYSPCLHPAGFGRAFLPEEEKPGKHRVVILSDSLWRRHFNGDRSIVGKAITLDSRSYTVVGILAANFEFPTPQSVDSAAKPKGPVELYIPAVLGKHRGGHNYRVIARLKSGVTLQQAQAQMNTIAGRLQQQYPISRPVWRERRVALRAGGGKVRMALLIMLGALFRAAYRLCKHRQLCSWRAARSGTRVRNSCRIRGQPRSNCETGAGENLLLA